MRAICGIQLKYRKRTTDLMLMLGLIATMDHLAMASSVHWYGHMLRMMDSHVLKRALVLEVKGHIKNGGPKEKWEEAC